MIRRAAIRIVAIAVTVTAVGADVCAQTAPKTDAKAEGKIVLKPDAPPLATYQAGPYVVYTDLQPPRVWKALARLEQMAELYARQTVGFGREMKGPLSVFLYSDYDDYRAALGAQAACSVGIYTGGELRAVADVRNFSRESIWHVIQHEGFHQVAHRVIARPGVELPLWLNEGLAEYFGEALWTGTRLLPGGIDAGKIYSKVPIRGGRAGRIRRRFAEGNFRPWPQLLAITSDQWRAGRGSTIDYDQVYAFVHYLIHGEDGKHHDAFARYVNEVSNGRPDLPTFKKHFGRDVEAVGDACREWWTHLPEQPAAETHAIVAAETLGNMLARAKNPNHWPTAETLLAAARDGKITLRSGGQTHMPAWLIVQAAAAAEQLGTWTLASDGETTTLSVQLPTGRTVSAIVTFVDGDSSGTVRMECDAR